jgi:hypothetical protein
MSMKAIVFSGLALVSAAAWAQQGDKRVEYKRTTVLEGFDDERVTGEFDQPGGAVVSVLPPLRHVSMIKVRADFLPELRKSAEQID